MPNVAQVLKLEIKRVAAKEVRAAGLAPKVTALNRRVRELVKRVKALEARPVAAPVRVLAAPAEAPAKKGRRYVATPAVFRRVRRKLDVTQVELAKLLGVSHSAVCQWEAGRANARPRTAAMLQAIERSGRREAHRRLASNAAPVRVAPVPAEAPAKRGRRYVVAPAVLKRVRRKLDVTQAELAKLLGVSHSAVYQWESGRLKARPRTGAMLQAIERIGRREAHRRLA